MHNNELWQNKTLKVAQPFTHVVCKCRFRLRSVVSMSRRNTQLESTLHSKQKLTTLAVRSAGTLP